METTPTQNPNTLVGPAPEPLTQGPRVYDFLEFRKFLSAYYEFKKRTVSGYSLQVFASRAKISARNYLKRVIDGERPLSSENLPKFVQALGLTPKESLYFEALVNYNQAKDLDTKRYYFQQMRVSAAGIKGAAIELTQAQFDVFGAWYILPVFEALDLIIVTNSAKIASVFKSRISSKEVEHALSVLERVGLIKFNSEFNKYEKTHTQLRYEKDVVNMAVQQFHQQMLDVTKNAISEEAIEHRYLRALSICLTTEEFEAVKKEISDFYQMLNSKYSNQQNKERAVVQINIQAVQLTEGVK